MPSVGDRLRLRWAAWWTLHPPLTLTVSASPAACLRTLTQASRPSQARLHLRDVFTEGRRYYVQAQPDGFRVTSDSRGLRGARKVRTRRAARVEGRLMPGGADAEPYTRIRLEAVMLRTYALRALILPGLFSLIVIQVGWWPLGLRLGLIAALFLLSWIGHRADAAYQANEMMFFVEKALADLPPLTLHPLEQPRPEVITMPSADEFERWWQSVTDSPP